MINKHKLNSSERVNDNTSSESTEMKQLIHKDINKLDRIIQNQDKLIEINQNSEIKEIMSAIEATLKPIQSHFEILHERERQKYLRLKTFYHFFQPIVWLLRFLRRPFKTTCILRDKIQIKRSKMFDSKYYSITYDMVSRGVFDLESDFINVGWKLGRNPSLNFNTNFYLEVNPKVPKDICPLLHYYRRGKKNGSYTRENEYIYDTICNSPFFDSEYYLNKYKDVRENGVDPVLHYINHGWKKGRNPSQLFNTTTYLKINPDVKSSHINPLYHYLRYGQKEQRCIKPTEEPVIKSESFPIINDLLNIDLVDVDYYIDQNNLDGFSMTQCLQHLVAKGWEKGLEFHSEFSKQGFIETEFITPETSIVEFISLVKPLLSEKQKRHALSINGKSAFAKMAKNMIVHNVFNPYIYLLNNRDFHGRQINLFEHFVRHGLKETRTGYSKKAILNCISSDPSISPPDISHALSKLNTFKSVGVVTHQKGNNFFLDIRDYFVMTLNNCGIHASSLDESSLAQSNSEHFLIIAPHEFFTFFESDFFEHRENQYSVYITEQPQSKHYYKNIDKTIAAQFRFDMNLSSAYFFNTVFERETSFLPLGYSKDFKHFRVCTHLSKTIKTLGLTDSVRRYDPSNPNSNYSTRPLDLFFIGAIANDTNSRRRALFFSDNAEAFSNYNNALFFVDGNAPVNSETPSSLSLEHATAIAQRSKIILNIHRENYPYFEWHRIAWLGFAQKCLVITETILDVPGFIVGEHYISCSLDKMSEMIHFYLSTKQGRKEAEAIIDSAYDRFVSDYCYEDKFIQGVKYWP